MISLKTLVKSIKETSLATPKKGQDTPMDARIQIPGYGVTTRADLRKNVISVDTLMNSWKVNIYDKSK